MSGSGRRVDVTFSPPTPNGDFHLGHLSGPLLGSDVYARGRKLAGDDVRFATSTDDNQTYVVTTALRLGVDPHSLIDEALKKMSDTLALARVEVDAFDRPGDDYQAFVRGFFDRLWADGAFDERTVHLPFDEPAGQYRAEAFVTGRCPTCLAHARAGVCEACGLYNLPGALLTFTTSDVRRVPVTIWVLDLERYRDRLERWYATVRPRLRPDLATVVDATLADRLPYVPITYPIDWGITVDWSGPDAPVQAINAWPEIFVGHVYWLNRSRSATAFDRDELVQFIGIDNGFYNAFCYVTLALLADEVGMLGGVPAVRTITNQYLLLDGRKFSTSKGDVVWAGDFLRANGADRSRFVLSLKSPELQQSEFSEAVAAQTLTDRFDRPLAAIEKAFAGLIGECVAGPPAPAWTQALAASIRRVERAISPETFSVRAAAEALAHHLELLADASEPSSPHDEADVSGRLQFLWSLHALAWPIAPGLAEAVGAAFGHDTRTPALRDAHTTPPETFRGLDLSTLAPLPATGT